MDPYNTPSLQTIQARYGPDISAWCVDSVRDFSYLLANQTNFNQDLSLWNVSSAETLEFFLAGATRFNQSLCAWAPQLVGVPVQGMLTGTACPSPESWCQDCPMLETKEAATAGRPTTVQQSANSVESTAKSMTLAKDHDTILSHPNQPDPNNNDEDEEDAFLAAYAAVHTHESTAKGAQLVLVLLLVIFSVQGLLLTLVRQRRRHLETTMYAQLSTTPAQALEENSPPFSDNVELAEIVTGVVVGEDPGPEVA